MKYSEKKSRANTAKNQRMRYAFSKKLLKKFQKKDNMRYKLYTFFLNSDSIKRKIFSYHYKGMMNYDTFCNYLSIFIDTLSIYDKEKLLRNHHDYYNKNNVCYLIDYEKLTYAIRSIEELTSIKAIPIFKIPHDEPIFILKYEFDSFLKAIFEKEYKKFVLIREKVGFNIWYYILAPYYFNQYFLNIFYNIIGY